MQQGGNDSPQAHWAPVWLHGGHPHKQGPVTWPALQVASWQKQTHFREKWTSSQENHRIYGMQVRRDAQRRYRVPAVTMVESPILVARSARRLMYLSPARDCGGRRACSSNGFPSPPSSNTYSIPKWACKDPTLSRNQLTAPGLLMFSFTQKAPRHWLITGIWKHRLFCATIISCFGN